MLQYNLEMLHHSHLYVYLRLCVSKTLSKFARTIKTHLF